MLKARSLAIALLGLACVASSAAPVQQQAAASSQMGRMLTEDLPLPSDWSRQVRRANMPWLEIGDRRRLDAARQPPGPPLIDRLTHPTRPQLQDETSLSGSTSYSFAFTDDRPEAGATADTPDTTSAGGADPGAAGPSNPGAGGITSPDAPDSTGAEDPNPATTGPLLTPAPTPAPTIAATPAPTPKGTIQAVEITMSIGGSQTLRVRRG